MDLTAENPASAQTARSEGGGPYKRKEVVLESAGRGGFARALAGAQSSAGGADGGVRVSGIVEDPSADRLLSALQAQTVGPDKAKLTARR